MSLVPKIKARPAASPDLPVEPPAPSAPLIQVLREQVVVKESVAAHGWRFVPRRDENNLIVEIIATPIE